jgi:hypothetical protein
MGRKAAGVPPDIVAIGNHGLDGRLKLYQLRGRLRRKPQGKALWAVSEPAELREFHLERLNQAARLLQGPGKCSELIRRPEGIKQGYVRHPSSELTIVLSANLLYRLPNIFGRNKHHGRLVRLACHSESTHPAANAGFK